MAFVSMKKTAEGEPQMAMMATFGTELYTKYVIVVDDDVDIFNMNDVMWAVATRVRAEKDGPRTVDLDVRADHLLGGLRVTGEERLRGQPHRVLHPLADRGEVGEDRVELVAERFSHAGTVGGPGCRPGRSGERHVNTRRALPSYAEGRGPTA